MRRVLTIARSEFQTAVRSRGFLVGIMLMPLLFGGAVVLQRIVERQSNSAMRRVGIVDETGQLFAPLAAATEAWNRGKRDIGPNVPDGPQFAVERIPPGPDRQALRLALSERVRRQELFAFVELPAGLLGTSGSVRIRYYSAAPAFRELPDWLQRAILKEVVSRRFIQANVSPIVVASLLKPVGTDEFGLAARATDGHVREAVELDRVRTIGIPVAFMFVLFLVVVMTTPQLMNSVLEEKMSRISEVLLGSVQPFELMLGKLLASTAVSAVMTVVYLTGGGVGRQPVGLSRRSRSVDGRLVRRLPAAVGADVRIVLHRHRRGVQRPEGRAEPDGAGDGDPDGPGVDLDTGDTGATECLRRRRVAVPAGDAIPDAAAPRVARAPARLAGRPRHAADAGRDDGRRLGRRPHRADRAADAGQGSIAGRDVEVDSSLERRTRERESRTREREREN